MPVPAVLYSLVLPLGDGPHHDMGDADRDLVIASGTAVDLDRACCRDPAHPVVQPVGPLFDLVTAERRHADAVANGTTRRMSAAHAVIL
ncbi:hypothetical protein MSTE_01437 [Mycobacteroides stephanolepidis]|uniref:Uncharacterized protein n=1 Tax=[Mycobacterium] stephanolepidis TaxID=1520670 RepID=A0A1Z4EV09_9MYCO|nr:hypothetical protein MSTE_01437 [[Mycobacterium] stephanolepidis]